MINLNSKPSWSASTIAALIHEFRISWNTFFPSKWKKSRYKESMLVIHKFFNFYFFLPPPISIRIRASVQSSQHFADSPFSNHKKKKKNVMWIFSCPPRKPLPTAYTVEIHWRSIRGLSHVLSVNVSKVSGLRGKAIIVKFFSSSRGAASSDFFFEFSRARDPPSSLRLIHMHAHCRSSAHTQHSLLAEVQFNWRESIFVVICDSISPKKKEKQQAIVTNHRAESSSTSKCTRRKRKKKKWNKNFSILCCDFDYSFLEMLFSCSPSSPSRFILQFLFFRLTLSPLFHFDCASVLLVGFFSVCFLRHPTSFSMCFPLLSCWDPGRTSYNKFYRVIESSCLSRMNFILFSFARCAIECRKRKKFRIYFVCLIRRGLRAHTRTIDRPSSNERTPAQRNFKIVFTCDTAENWSCMWPQFLHFSSVLFFFFCCSWLLSNKNDEKKERRKIFFLHTWNIYINKCKEIKNERLLSFFQKTRLEAHKLLYVQATNLQFAILFFVIFSVSLSQTTQTCRRLDSRLATAQRIDQP